MTDQETARKTFASIVEVLDLTALSLSERQQCEMAIAHALAAEREACVGAVNALMGKDSGNWNRAIAYAADAIRTRGR